MDVPAARNQRLRTTFDGAAAGYEVRPPYPAPMYDRIVADAGIGPGCEVVEVGPGTGQATIPLLDLGCRVTAVELGEQLATRLRARTAGRPVEVIVSSFEEVELPDAAFDAVVSATAFHWVDRDVGIPKAFRLLRPGGSLVLVWNVFGDLDRDDPFHDALTEMLARVAPQLAQPMVPGQTSPEAGSWAAAIDAQHLFEPARPHTYRWTATHSTDELVALFSTFSSWLDLGPERMAVVLDELVRIADGPFGGSVTRPYQTVLVTARKPNPTGGRPG